LNSQREIRAPSAVAKNLNAPTKFSIIPQPQPIQVKNKTGRDFSIPACVNRLIF
jgi:hypothetical protein